MAEENVGAGVEVQNGGGENGNTKAVSFFSLKPQLVVEAPKATDAVQFYKAAFGAEEVKRDMHPKRKADQELPLILSAELKLGSSVLIVSDQSDDSSSLVVKSNGSGYVLCLETDDVEGAVGKAVKAGAVTEGEIAEGEGCVARVAKVRDPFGYIWSICSGNKATVAAVNVEA